MSVCPLDLILLKIGKEFARSQVNDWIEEEIPHSPLLPREKYILAATTKKLAMQSVLPVCRGVHQTSGDALFDNRSHKRAGMRVRICNVQNRSIHDLGRTSHTPYTKQLCRDTLAAHRSKVSLVKLLQVRRLWALWRRESAEELQGTLSGILASVVDVLAVIPEASMDSLATNSNGA
jgi:hypothetical protein